MGTAAPGLCPAGRSRGRVYMTHSDCFLWGSSGRGCARPAACGHRPHLPRPCPCPRPIGSFFLLVLLLSKLCCCLPPRPRPRSKRRSSEGPPLSCSRVRNSADAQCAAHIFGGCVPTRLVECGQVAAVGHLIVGEDSPWCGNVIYTALTGCVLATSLSSRWGRLPFDGWRCPHRQRLVGALQRLGRCSGPALRCNAFCLL